MAAPGVEAGEVQPERDRLPSSPVEWAVDRRNRSPSMADRLKELCELFPTKVSGLRRIEGLAKYSTVGRVAAKTGGGGNTEEEQEEGEQEKEIIMVDCVARLNVYRAWCFLFREGAADGRRELLDSLLRWLDGVHFRYPPVGVEGGVEQLRLYATLRGAVLNKVLASESQQIMAYDILSRQPIGLLLPFMQTTLDADEFENIAAAAFFHPSDTNGGSTHVGTLDVLDQLRRFASEEKGAQYGDFDKHLLLLGFKARSTRSGTYISFLGYLRDLERNSMTVVQLESKFSFTMRIIMRYAKSYAPSVAVAQTLYLEAVRIASVARELNNSMSLASTYESFVEETKTILDNTLEASRNSNLRASLSALSGIGGDTISKSSSFKSASSKCESSYAPGYLPTSQTSSNQRRQGPSSRQQSSGWSSGASHAASQANTGLFGRSSNGTGVAGLSGTFSLSSGRSQAKGASSRGASAYADEDAESLSEVSAHSVTEAGPDKLRQPTSTMYDHDYFSTAPPGTKISQAEHVWLQVDPSKDSLAANAPEEVGDDEVTSMHPGVMRMFKNKITWVMSKPPAEEPVDAQAGPLHEAWATKEEPVASENMSFGALSGTTDVTDLHMKALAVYDVSRKSAALTDDYLADFRRGIVPDSVSGDAGVAGRMNTLATPISQQFVRLMTSYAYSAKASQRSQERNGVRTEDEEVHDSQFVVPISSITKYASGSLGDEGNWFIALYTSREVIKLFPLGRAEALQLTLALQDLTGEKVLNIDSLAAAESKRSLQEMRLAAHRKLGRNWINHTEDLHHILREVTKDDVPIKMRDMERIFHSARRNKAVVGESIRILEEIWTQAKGQDSMNKVLGVVDRMLDGGVLHGEDTILKDLLQWLHRIEAGLDPYAHSRPLKLLLRVCHRVESLQQLPMVPLIVAYYEQDIFRFRSEYKHFVDSHCDKY